MQVLIKQNHYWLYNVQPTYFIFVGKMKYIARMPSIAYFQKCSDTKNHKWCTYVT